MVSLGVVLMLISFSNMIIPDGGIKKYSSLAMGFMLICSALSFLPTSADEVVFAPIFGAREQGDDSIMDKLVASVKQKMPVKLFSSYEQICDYLVANVKSGERIVIVGAGSIDKLSRLFLETT